MSNSSQNGSKENISQLSIQTGNISPDMGTPMDIHSMLDQHSSKIKTLEERVVSIEDNISTIKSNYLTTGTFFKVGGSVLATIITAAGFALWTIYAHLDNKFEARFTKIDERFEKVETNIHSLDIRLVKVEQKLDIVENRLGIVEKKIDSIDEKLDLLLQQKLQANR